MPKRRIQRDSEDSEKRNGSLRLSNQKRQPVTVEFEQRKNAPEATGSSRAGWNYIPFGVLAILLAVFYAYGPVLYGRFVFDDFGLPFYSPTRSQQPLLEWIGHERPLLMLTYWFNFQISERNTFSYHVVNVLIHATTAIILFFITRRLLELFEYRYRARDIVAAIVSAVFLLHPLQTESVAYIAGRSECLSTLFMVSAYYLFLCAGSGQISWPSAAAIVLLFVCALAVKEHTVVLPALFILTDVIPRNDSILAAIRRRSRLYIALAFIFAIGVVSGIRALATSTSAGFGLADFTWYQYLLTQFRVIWLYLRLFVLPVEQNADYIIAVSRTLADPAPWIGLGALLLAILVAAKYRYRYRLAWFGVLLFLLLLSPTSSFLPIKDAAVERRMYLPSFALLLICIDLLRDVRIKPLLAGSACVFVALFAATRARAHLWSSGAILWEDVLAKSPHNLRGYTHLVYGYLRERRCADAARRLDHLPPSIQPDVPLLVSWSHVYTCLSRYDDAIAKLEEATAQKPSADVYTLIAVAQRRLGNDPAARAAIEEALVLDPNFEAAQAVRQELAGDSSKPEN